MGGLKYGSETDLSPVGEEGPGDRERSRACLSLAALLRDFFVPDRWVELLLEELVPSSLPKPNLGIASHQTDQ